MSLRIEDSSKFIGSIVSIPFSTKLNRDLSLTRMLYIISMVYFFVE